MLQIITGMYFRDVPLNETTHRAVLYTNAQLLGRDIVALPNAELHPSTSWTPVTTVTVAVQERLEAVRPDGQADFLIATSGTEIIADLAAVLSFATNLTFHTDHDLVHRLVPAQLDERSRRTPSSILRRTFDPQVVLLNPDVDDLRAFMTQLLSLHRPRYDAAMRAIRRVVDACNRAADDPTLAYTLFVAALESLSEGADATAPSWESLDKHKRDLVDKALHDTDNATADRVRTAVLDAERLGAGRRFETFVLSHVQPSYYRTEATDAVRPVAASELPRALRRAYGIRSRNVHVLEELPPEAWVFTDRAELIHPAGRTAMLSLEGLNRLARHVIREYVTRADTHLDTTFDWRRNLPGILRMRLAAQYWLGSVEGYGHDTAADHLEGFLGLLIDVLAERDGTALPDLRPVLDRIEQLVPGRQQQNGSTEMVAVYYLWHAVMRPEFHQPAADTFLAKHGPLLQTPSITSFATDLLASTPDRWTLQDLRTVADDRRDRRLRGKTQPIPTVFDAALHVVLALNLLQAGREDEAAQAVSHAVEIMPGNPQLTALETAILSAPAVEFDTRRFVLGLVPSEPPDEAQADAEVGGEIAAEARGEARPTSHPDP